MNISNNSKGVYFLANNKVLNLTIAFLNSFKAHNYDLDLCFIPYDDDIDEIIHLRHTYNFVVYENMDLLELCDQISIKFHGIKVGAYRKLAIWEGFYDQFIYIDIDTIVLKNLSFVWKNLNHCKIFTSHSNLSHIRRWVWKESIYNSGKLSNLQIEYAANTGFIVSTKGTIQMNWVVEQIEAALVLKDDMQLLCMEQPFLNYLIVTSGYNYGSLLSFYNWDALNGTNTGVELEYWAGRPGGKTRKGTFISPEKRPTFLLHWAGVWRNNEDITSIPYFEIWDYYRNLNTKKIEIPNKKKAKNIFSKLFANLNKIEQ